MKRKVLTKRNFESYLSELSNEINENIYVGIQKIVTDANNRGILSSGITIKAMLDLLRLELDNKLKSALDKIEDYQKEMNFNLKESLLNEVEEMYLDFFTSCYEKHYWDNIFSQAKRYVGEDLAKNSVSNEVFHLNIRRIKKTISNRINDIKNKNKVRKEHSSIRIAKKSLFTSIAALIVSIIATLFAIFSK